MFLQIVTLFAVTLSIQGDDSHAISEQKVVIRHQPPNKNAGIHYGQKKIEHHEEYARTYPSYEFSYKVSDPETKDMKGQHESRDGDKVKGTYWLVEPTGHKRTVKYSADDDEGFKAKIRYSATSKPYYEDKKNENDDIKQNNDGQNGSNELIKNNDEQNDKSKEDVSMNQDTKKLNDDMQIPSIEESSANELRREKLQINEDTDNNGFETPQNEDSSRNINVNSNSGETTISGKLNSKEEMSASIGAQATHEIKQIRHGIHKNNNRYIHENNYNGRNNNIRARDEIKIVYRSAHKNDELKKETDNESVKPVVEELSDTKEEINDNNGQFGSDNNLNGQTNNKKNGIEMPNKSRGTNNLHINLKKDYQSNKKESNEHVKFNSNDQIQGTKRHRENHGAGRVSSKLSRNKIKGDNNIDQSIQNKVPPNNNPITQRVSQDNREIKDNVEPITNTKNSKNSIEARANYFKQLAETNNIKHKKNNKEDNTKEEVFEHHIVVFHS